MAIHFKIRVYRNEKIAKERYTRAVVSDKNIHPDFKHYPRLEYKPEYKRWILTETIVYSKRKPGPKRKRSPLIGNLFTKEDKKGLI